MPSSIFGALDFAQTTNRIPPDSSAMMPLWAIAGEVGVERETTFPSRVTQSPGCAAATGFCSVGPPVPPALPPNPVAGAILNSFASSFDTLRSASAGWTPNSSMSRRSLPSTFWRSISFPVFGKLTGDSLGSFGIIHSYISKGTSDVIMGIYCVPCAAKVTAGLP